MSQLQEQILTYLPPGLREFIQGSSRRDLLKKINTTLLVLNDEVVHLDSGKSAVLQECEGPIDPDSLAVACKRLLGEDNLSNSILLLLPPVEFVATTKKMPGITKDTLISAILLQADSLLPGNNNPVSLAISPRSVELDDEQVALWITNARMVELFTAFAQQKLFIAAIRPRILSVHQQSEEACYIDSDEHTMTYVKLRDGVLRRWLLIDKIDLEQAEFEAQWRENITATNEARIVELNTVGHYLEQSDKNSNLDYTFFPPGALSARKQFEKGRKLLLAAAIIAGLMLLSSIPFLLQSIEFRSLAANLESQRVLSNDARQDQAVVVSFENELGPISDFPEQRVREALFTLQNVLSPNQLSSLELSDGLIKLQGASTEPQSILQRLEQDPLFTEVIFSRATNNDRYFIDLRLSTVNFEAYMVRYFPDE